MCKCMHVFRLRGNNSGIHVKARQPGDKQQSKIMFLTIFDLRSSII